MIETVGTYLRIGNRETVQQAREKREQFSSFDQALGAFLSESKDVRVKDARLYVAFGHQLLMESIQTAARPIRTPATKTHATSHCDTSIVLEELRFPVLN